MTNEESNKQPDEKPFVFSEESKKIASEGLGNEFAEKPESIETISAESIKPQLTDTLQKQPESDTPEFDVPDFDKLKEELLGMLELIIPTYTSGYIADLLLQKMILKSDWNKIEEKTLAESSDALIDWLSIRYAAINELIKKQGPKFQEVFWEEFDKLLFDRERRKPAPGFSTRNFFIETYNQSLENAKKMLSKPKPQTNTPKKDDDESTDRKGFGPAQLN